MFSDIACRLHYWLTINQSSRTFFFFLLNCSKNTIKIIAVFCSVGASNPTDFFHYWIIFH